jgi:23S rRNA (guanine745-N1)-methyltransferase
MGGVLDEVIRYLACARCGAALARAGGSLRCGAGHAFDIARQGYVSLLPAGATAAGGAAGGDTAAMVQARFDFLAAGHFASLAAELGQAASLADGPGCVADVGAGTGYYLAAVLDRLPERAGLALDVSKFSLRRAARAHQRIGAVRCDVWRGLPVADGAAALALNVFAPRHGAELRRILGPAGRLLVVTPLPDHLGELVAPLGLLTVDQRKQQRLTGKLSPYFELDSRREHRAMLSLDRPAVGALVAMGPSSWHADAAALAERVARLPDPAPVTLAVALSSYRPVPVTAWPAPGAGRLGPGLLRARR